MQLAYLANAISCSDLALGSNYGRWNSEIIEFNRLFTPRRISPMPWGCQGCAKPCPWAPSPTTGNCSYWPLRWAPTDPAEPPTRAWTPSGICCSSSSEPMGGMGGGVFLRFLLFFKDHFISNRGGGDEELQERVQRKREDPESGVVRCLLVSLFSLTQRRHLGSF